jgi:hypothetical protein
VLYRQCNGGGTYGSRTLNENRGRVRLADEKKKWENNNKMEANKMAKGIEMIQQRTILKKITRLDSVTGSF